MKKLITIYLLIYSISHSFSQGFTHKIYTTEDGLLSNFICGIIQDNKGNLWLQHANGFTKFDGKTFEAKFNKKAVANWNWDYGNFSSTTNGEIIFTEGLKLGRIPNEINDQVVDSNLVFRNTADLNNKKFINLIDKEGYRIFSLDRTINNQSTLDSVFYQYNEKIKAIPVTKKYSRTTSKIKYKNNVYKEVDCLFLLKDNLKQVYLRFSDTLNFKTIIYQFEHGKIKKLIETSNIGCKTRIVRTPNNNLWLISNINRNLVIECYDSDFKLIKTLERDNFFDSETLWGCSEMLPDSKNNIWFSWRHGLVKINANEIRQISDNRRNVFKKSYAYYDEYGNEQFHYEDDYSNFINAFGIDKYDNIISGERLFDGMNFSYLASEDKFSELFNQQNYHSLSNCFVDRENNIWLSIQGGLLKLSPIPFKKIDKRLSFEESEFLYECRDFENRYYYIKEVLDKRKIVLRVYEKNELVKERVIKSDNVSLDVIPFSKGVILNYNNEKGEMVLEYDDMQNVKQLCIKAEQGRFTRLNRKIDTALFFVFTPNKPSNKIVLICNSSNIQTIQIPDSIANIFNNIPFGSLNNVSKNWNYIVTGNQKVFKLNSKSQLVKTTLVGFPNSFFTEGNEYKFYYEVATKTSYYLDQFGTFVKIKDNVIENYKNENWDSLSKLFDFHPLYSKISSRSMFRDLIKIKDLFVFCSGEELVVFREIGENRIKFYSKIIIAEQKGMESFSPLGFYIENNWIALTGESDTRIISYEDILNNDLSMSKRYPVSLNLYSGITKDSTGLNIAGDFLSFLGKRGFNTLPPVLSDFEIVYMNSGMMTVEILKNGASISIPYSNSKIFMDYKAVCLTDGNKVKYKYKLEGFDPDWQITKEAGTKYTSLSPGSYTLMVYASNNEGIWTSDYNSLIIEITPPWYRTWFAYLSYIVIVIGVFYLIMKSRTKQLILEKAKLEQIIIERTKEVVNEKKVIENQKHLIEEKHREITDSINYAERIQRSFMATKEMLDENLKDYFVLLQPKDVVSGDFYWASELNNSNFALVTADSTGHGVPGAIMSLLNIASLEKSIENEVEPAKIFNNTRKIIIERLKKDGSEEGGKDGMDVSIISFNKKKTKLTYCGANNPIWIVRSSSSIDKVELIELEPNKMPVGKHDKDDQTFTQQEFLLQKGDVIYTLTDGYPDQFGGTRGKKFMYKQLKELLVDISPKPMAEQKEILQTELEKWMGDNEQVDDICVIGIKI